MKLCNKVTFILASVLFIVSCESGVNSVPEPEVGKLPSLIVENFTTTMTDSGKTDLVLKSPVMEQYDNTDDPYIEFKKGISVFFYDGFPEPQGTATSKYARYDQKDDLWELKDSVVVFNNKNEKLETELLYWDQKKDLVYTDRFVKLTEEKQISQGFGFESDSKLRIIKIKKLTSEIYIDEED
ncbi:MAG TPA: LPS export ABC transporter periplasmic protein LptC [Bacteroidales bacterium]|nr:LPS export ABC transporter periplasmic protein LptC [Bacteroidales bacterium]